MTDTLMTTSAVVVSEVDVLIGGVLVDTITEVLPGGYITLDTTAENIRSVTFSCLDPNGTLMPYGANNGELMPTGVEVALKLGFVIDGEPVLWPQGVYGVQEVDVTTAAGDTDSGAGNFPGPGPNLTITAVDRSYPISVNVFEDTFTINAGTPMGEAIEQILASQAPWCTNPNIAPTDFEIAQQVFSPGDDPWQQIVAIAASGGMVAYFDNTGTLVVRPTPSAAGATPTVAIVDGPDNVAISCTPIYSNNPGYNGVIVVNTTSGATVTNADGTVTDEPEQQLSGSAFDMNPSSPTYALGPYGYRPAPPVTVTTATTNEQCTAIAQALLPQVLGMSNSVVIDNLPIPQLDAYDLVYVSNAATNYEGTVILQQMTLYLDYTEQETITLVPLGTPVTDLAYLKGPSQAAYGSSNPYYAGAGEVAYTYTPYSDSSSSDDESSSYSYSYSEYGSSGSSGSSDEADRGAGLGILYIGDRIARVFRNTRGGSDYEDAEEDVDEAADDLADDLDDL